MRLGPRLAVVLLAALAMAAFTALYQRFLLPAGFWGIRPISTDDGLHLQLATLAVGLVALQLWPARAHAILVGEGALCLVGYGLLPAASFAGVLVLWFALLEAPLPRALQPYWALLLLLSPALLLARWPGLRAPAFFFSVLFTLRLVVYSWEKWQNRFERGDFKRYCLYMLSPPLAVFAPYNVFVPFYGRHLESISPALTVERARRGLTHLGYALLWSATLALLVRAKYWAGIGIPSTILESVFELVLTVLKVARLAHLVFGLLLLHGIEDRAPIDRPLLSRTYVEMWQRFQIHQKDLQVALFYNPTLLWLRRKNRYFAIVVATTLTMFVGNFVIHFFPLFVYDWSSYAPHFRAWALFDLYSTLVLAGGLCLGEWRRRRRRPPPEGALGALWQLAGWSFTLIFSAELMLMQ